MSPNSKIMQETPKIQAEVFNTMSMQTDFLLLIISWTGSHTHNSV